MKDRTIVVTGAGSGIGAATARRFAVAGDRVILVGRREERLKEVADQIGQAKPGAATYVHATDAADPDGVTALADEIRRRWDGVDGLVCCAGSAPQTEGDSLVQIAKEWEGALRSNVMTAAISVEGLLPVLRDNSSIVLFSSIAAYRGSGGTGAYGAAKAALHSYIHTLAGRVGARGINVNAIAPGFVDETEFFGDRLADTRRTMLIRQTALGRAGRPEDIANAGYFLCSAEGAYLTSQILQINGGSNHGV
ncbi:MAG: SDR family NAD(P)-dependent oxidoreductase [Segniliparus sp.]|uniref:SDR family NAD(P)-dependent oxidoreductase n=1 Tax=Segniliparus sp. TaxID=2804064 RepID=UPI003F3CA1D3